jgi:hypothetical protein
MRLMQCKTALRVWSTTRDINVEAKYGKINVGRVLFSSWDDVGLFYTTVQFFLDYNKQRQHGRIER